MKLLDLCLYPVSPAWVFIVIIWLWLSPTYWLSGVHHSHFKLYARSVDKTQHSQKRLKCSWKLHRHQGELKGAKAKGNVKPDTSWALPAGAGTLSPTFPPLAFGPSEATYHALTLGYVLLVDFISGLLPGGCPLSVRRDLLHPESGTGFRLGPGSGVWDAHLGCKM